MSHRHFHKTLIATLTLVAICLATAPAKAHEGKDWYWYDTPDWAHFKLQTPTVEAAPDWRQGYTLIIMDNADMASANAARDYVEGLGGRIAVLLPPHAMMGWVSPELAERLPGNHGIEKVVYAPVAAGEMKYNDERTRTAVSFFNSAVDGSLEKAQAREPGPEALPLAGDALPPQDIDYDAYRQNLESHGISLPTAADGPGVLPGNTDTMVGKVGVVLFFVESSGAIDSNSYTWSSTHQQNTFNQVAGDLSWWSSRAQAYGKSLTFTVAYYSSTSPVTQQGYEPILHSSSQDSLWINAIMANLGFTSGDKIARVTAFNTYYKGYAQTDWAYSVFVGYNPSPAPDRFTDNYFAYAHLGGPFVQMLYRNDGWGEANFGLVLRHETGHIFWACDEYSQPGYAVCSCTPCTGGAGPRPNAANGNCEACNTSSIACVMRSNENGLCSYTVEQIGWGGGGTTTKPNLTPYQPPGWSDKIVVSKVTGTNTNDTSLSPTDTLYLDWALINSGSAATADTFYATLYIDGVSRGSWYVSPPFNANYYTYVTDFYVGSLAAGQHTARIVLDDTGVIPESNESDNDYSKSFTVASVGSAPSVTTQTASFVSTSSATLNASVTPNGLSTTAWFEYGTSSTLASYGTTAGQALGSGTSAKTVGAALSGLATNTTYYFRSAASNSAGTSRGSILSFKTGTVRARKTQFDFDGDGRADIVVWRASNGTWYGINSSNGASWQRQWGSKSLGDVPVSGDFDGDGRADVAVWRASNGTWYGINSSNGASWQRQWGSYALGDVPMPGDFDNDGRTDVVVWRASNGTWYGLNSSNGASWQQQWGSRALGDVPVSGDFDGDGRADVAVWRASNGTWYVLKSSNGAAGIQQWGSNALGDLPTPGDFDNDGRTDVAVWRASNGTWYGLNSSNGASWQRQWGSKSLGDMTTAADFDNDGRADVAVWRATNGTWYGINSSNGASWQRQWGSNALGDLPILRPIGR